MQPVIIVSIVSVLLVAACVSVCRLFMRKTYDSVDRVLDRILARDESVRHETTGEDRISKLAHKASRIMDIYVSEKAQTAEEKEIIQGFISDMSHQMKTPLSGISMYADLLLEGGATEEERNEFYSRIQSSAESLKWMTESLIKMSRLEAGAVQLSPVPQGIRQTVSDSVTSVLAAASKKDIEISAEDFDDVRLLHDRRWTREAFVNVLENAVKYSEVGGKIRISIERLPVHTKVVVTDNGKGVEKNDFHKIFKRFYRGSNAKSEDGAGLGLYLVSLIMEKQGGYIMVDSIPGEYASFSLFLRNG